MRQQEQILAEMEAARKEFVRAEASFTGSARGQIDPDQEVADNPTEEMFAARDRYETARIWLERVSDEYNFYLEHQHGAQGTDEGIGDEIEPYNES